MEGKEQSKCSISDLSYNTSTGTLYILESRTGLYKTNIQVANSKEIHYSMSNISIVSEISNCDALDVVSDYHFVLVCQVSMPNSYVQ